MDVLLWLLNIDWLLNTSTNIIYLLFLVIQRNTNRSCRFPTQVEDCYASLLWIYNHAEELNIDVDKIAIAGDSAGGTIAAVVALMARDRLGPTLARQILIYPCLIDPTNESIESHTRYANGPVVCIFILFYLFIIVLKILFSYRKRLCRGCLNIF